MEARMVEYGGGDNLSVGIQDPRGKKYLPLGSTNVFTSCPPRKSLGSVCASTQEYKRPCIEVSYVYLFMELEYTFEPAGW